MSSVASLLKYPSSNTRSACALRRATSQTLVVKSFTSSSVRIHADEDFSTARTWLQSFDSSALPLSIGDVSYSRSSGPGGQNVNKVNSKAQLRVPLQNLLPLIPSVLHPAIRESRYYAQKTNSLLIQADDSRKQATNKEACFKKLHEMLLDAGRRVVPGETTQAQKEKVKSLKQYENEARLRSKKQHAGKKLARSKTFGD